MTTTTWVQKLFFYPKQVIGVVSLILNCALLPKNRILIFNHSSRVRKSFSPARSLYLSTVTLNKAIIFEDTFIQSRDQSIKRLYAFYVARSSYLVGTLANKLYKLFTGKDERDFFHFYIAYTCWKLLFRLLRPQAIRLLVWYGKEPIIAAAKSLMIEVADIQHGIIYQSHPFYNRIQSDTIANSDFLLPDICYVYGEYWRSLLVKSGWEPTSVRLCGYFLNTGSSPAPKINTPFILYTSQPHVTDMIIAHINSIKDEAAAKGINIVIAPHPSESRMPFKSLISEKIRLYDDLDSYDLLSQCLVHVSVSSTLLWEAMLFGKSSYILNYGLEAMDLLEDLITYGYGRAIANHTFPAPFSLPEHPSVDFFFAPKDERVFNHAS